jgi:hypothetical protein
MTGLKERFPSLGQPNYVEIAAASVKIGRFCQCRKMPADRTFLAKEGWIAVHP